MKKESKKCTVCKTSFFRDARAGEEQWKKRKFCSHVCYWKDKKGSTPWNKGKKGEYHLWPNGRKFSRATLEKMSISHVGKKQSKETIAKRIKRREQHYAWKGDDVGYDALHSWVKKELGQPSRCEHCKTTKRRKYHWANKSGEYRRLLSDWIRLCVPCHSKYDHARS